MADPKQQASLNTLLKWGIENSGDQPSQSNGENPQPRLDPGILDAVFGGPSDADIMKASMVSIRDPTVPLDEKMIAFENFEQLVEGIDNANNLAALDLWSPLVSLLGDPEPKLRFMAAWCVGTAVQNNEKAQETAVTIGALPILVRLATGTNHQHESSEDTEAPRNLSSEKDVRRKACYAISSAIRNYQPGAKVVVDNLPKDMNQKYSGLDATDMNAVDQLMSELRSIELK